MTSASGVEYFNPFIGSGIYNLLISPTFSFNPAIYSKNSIVIINCGEGSHVGFAEPKALLFSLFRSVLLNWGQSPENYLAQDCKGKLIGRDRFLEYGDNDLEKSRLSYLKFVEDGLLLKKESDFLTNKWMF